MRLRTESMVYTDTPPWTGVGIKVAPGTGIKKILEAANLNWKAELRPLQVVGGKQITNKFGLVRSDNGYCLGVVGGRYKPTQNDELFQFMDEYVREGGATMEVAGALDGGRVVWGMAKLKGGFRMPGTRDQTNGYLFLANPHGVGRATKLGVTAIRDVCNNTLSIAMRDKSAVSAFRLSHSNLFDDLKQTEAREVIGAAVEGVSRFEKAAKKLAKVRITDEDAKEIFRKNFAPKAKVSDPEGRAWARVYELLDCYKQAPGATPGNLWGVLNAATYYTDHIASNGNNTRAREALVGRGDQSKRRLFSSLLEMAG